MPKPTPWQQRRQRDLAKAGIREGPDFLYRPRQCLISDRDLSRLRPSLRQAGGVPDAATNSRLQQLKLGLSRWIMPSTVDIPRLLAQLRALGDDDWEPTVAANTVLAGEPRYQGGPGGSPRPARPLPPTMPASSGLGGTTTELSVLDTGYAASVRTLHASLAARLRPDPDDVDVLDTEGDHVLDFEAAHGTFISGLAHRLAPQLRIDPERVLDPRGWGDDVSVAMGMAQQRSPVVNCSFGGYTEGDRAPLALQEALRSLGRDVVVVAAAGNNDSDRPFWPAAFKRVIAVAALDTTVTPHRPAAFSNYGWWVDVCAPGVDLHSAYVNGVWQLDPSQESMTFAGWAAWSGTSFAAPLLAATVAAGVAESGQSARKVAAELLASLGPVPGHPDHGLLFEPATDLVYRPGSAPP
jgi:subtilisin family serine protease